MGYAKITKPRTTGAIKRARLFRMLDRGKRVPVTWVSGPPGAGKTMLVASYLSARKIRSVWYRLDESDLDLATLFQYLSWAMPSRSAALPVFKSEYQAEFLVFARNYFRKLFARMRPPFALVFDDYQQAPIDADIHAVIGVAAAEVPVGARVFIVSRGDPPPSFARMRAHQDFVHLGWSDLQFTLSEAVELSKGKLPKSAVQAACEMANGWAAGLVLLMAQSAPRLQVSHSPDAPSSKLLFDYFAGELFRKTPLQTQDFLMQTAFLPSIAVAVAEELTGSANASALLIYLQRSNYFIQQHTGDTLSFRYHPLFREFLISQAGLRFSAERMRALRVKAAAVVEPRGEHDMAAQLLLDGECWEEFSAFILRNVRTLLRQGRQHLVVSWISRIPAALLTTEPWLLYWRGMASLAGSPEACYLDIERAFPLFRAQEDIEGAYLAWVLLVNAYHLEAMPCTLSDRWIPILETLMREHPFPTLEIEALVTGTMICALAYRNPHPERTTPWMKRWQDLRSVVVDPAMRVYVHAFQVVYYTQLADFSGARRVVEEAKAIAAEAQASPTVTATAKVTDAWQSLYTASSSGRRRSIAEAVDYFRTIGLRGAQWHVLHCLGAFAALSDEDLAAAQPYLHQLESERERFGLGFHCWYESFMVRKALLLGSISEARRRQPEMMRLSDLCGSPRMEVSTVLLSAQVFHVCGEASEAHQCLQRIYKMAAQLSNPFFEFSARLVEAQLLLEKGEENDGIAMLGRAMSLGRAHHISHTHNWRRSVVARLCLKCLEAGIEPAYVNELIQLRELTLDKATLESERWPWELKVYTLGGFSILKQGEALRWKGKSPRKPLALLKAIIALGGRKVREEVVIDLLWPDLEGPQGRFALKTALHRLRKLLGSLEIILRESETLSLNPRCCWVDVWAIENSVSSTAASDGDIARTETWRRKILEPAMTLSAAEFLEGEHEVAWPTHYIDGLRRRLNRKLRAPLSK